MGTAPMTAVLADFLTKLGWSGICVGPMKPPPGNEAGNWGHLVMVELVEPQKVGAESILNSKGKEFILSENKYNSWHVIFDFQAVVSRSVRSQNSEPRFSLGYFFWGE